MQKNAVSNIKSIINEIPKKYKVEDLNTEKAKIIFLLESPHADEVKEEYPLAGSSGETMTEYVSAVLEIETLKKGKKIIPLGELINDNEKNFKVFGIMNVFNYPLQKKAYGKINNGERYRNFFKAIKTIRNNPNSIKRRKNSPQEELEKIILNNLKNRLEIIKKKCFNYSVRCFCSCLFREIKYFRKYLL